MGHPIKISMEFAGRIWVYLHGSKYGFRHIRDEFPDLFGSLVNEPEPGPGKSSVTSCFRFVSLFKLDDFLGARLARSEGSLESGAASPYDDDIAGLPFHQTTIVTFQRIVSD
jgi:hypothetical protein